MFRASRRLQASFIATAGGLFFVFSRNPRVRIRLTYCNSFLRTPIVDFLGLHIPYIKTALFMEGGDRQRRTLAIWRPASTTIEMALRSGETSPLSFLAINENHLLSAGLD